MKAPLQKKISTSVVDPREEELFPNFINRLPCEILYQILTLCDGTYDIIRSTRDCHEKECFSVGRGCGSKAFGQVCRQWKTCIKAGMVPSTPLSEIQLTDEQFLGIAEEERTSPKEPSEPDTSQPLLLRGYHTITIVYNRRRGGTPRNLSDSRNDGPILQILAPKQLNLVITNERIADISQVLNHFKTLRSSIQDNFQEDHLASHEIIDTDRNISITVWNGCLCTPPRSNRLPPDQPLLALGISSGFGTADLYINNWTGLDSFGDIPWIFGQFCRNAKPHTLGFHMLSPHSSMLTDQWHIQNLFTGSDNTLLRRLNISGIGSDGFLRLLQCSAIQIWCVKELWITLPAAHLPDESFWDWRIFETGTWPVYEDVDEGCCDGFFASGDDLRNFVTFPKLALARLVDGRIQSVDKERMETRCQIANFEPESRVEDTSTRNDIERFTGRSLRWASLAFVKVDHGVLNSPETEITFD